MRLTGRSNVAPIAKQSTSSESSRARKRRGGSRGGWYQDPFGAGEERWWDGGQWTGEVRGSASADGVALSTEDQPRPPERPTSPEPAASPDPRPSPDRSSARESRDTSSRGEQPPRPSGLGTQRDQDFPVSIETVVGEQLTIVPGPRKPGVHCQVLTSRGRAASISLFGGQMARVACAHGTWVLRRSLRDEQGLTLESADRRPTGKYVRRRWPPGGTIRLIDGTAVELRGSRGGRWRVQSVDGRKCLAQVRRVRSRSVKGDALKVSVHSLPGDTGTGTVILLAACAVLMLPAGADLMRPRARRRA